MIHDENLAQLDMLKKKSTIYFSTDRTSEHYHNKRRL